MVRVAWYAPGSSVGTMPFHRQAAARKIAFGCVNLLWRGVTERRRCGCLDLGILPSLQIYNWRRAMQGLRLPATRMSSREAMWLMSEFLRGILPGGALLANENDPQGDEVFSNVKTLAREFLLTLPVNENDPRGGRDFPQGRGFGVGIFAGGGAPHQQE